MEERSKSKIDNIQKHSKDNNSHNLAMSPSLRKLTCLIFSLSPVLLVDAKYPLQPKASTLLVDDIIRLPRAGGDIPKPPTENTKSWSSFVEVDPSKLLTILVQKTGLIVTGEEKKIAHLIKCDEAKLNVGTGAILIKNLSVALPGSPPSLKIGKIHVSWDSYVHPCLEIEVEDVDITVSFNNVFLTKNNWYVFDSVFS